MAPDKRRTIWIVNQYASTPDTGMGGRHYYLAKELAKLGHRVYLISSGYNHLLRHPPEMKSEIEIQELAEGFNFVWIRTTRYRDAHDRRRIWNWFSFAWKMKHLPQYIDAKPDAIVASSPAPFVFLGARLLARRFGAKLGFEVRDIWPLSLIQIGGYATWHPFVRLIQWLEDKAYRESDVVISVLPNALEHMQQHGLTQGKFAWIPNGFDLEEAEAREPLAESTVAALPRDRFIVGYAGTLGFANALDYFIDAAALAHEDDSIAWVIVGDGREKARLQQKVAQLELTQVYFVDAIPKSQMQSLLGCFDVSYIGLTRDPLFRFGVSPNKLFDYLYAARPVLYAIESGDYHPVDEADAGLSLPAQDAAAIYKAVIELKAMPRERRQQMGRNGRQYALQKHEYSQLAKQFAQVLIA